MPPSDQCAVGPDGKLLDQHAIIWYNDPEDSTPIAPVTSPAIRSASSTSSALKATTLRTFFNDGTTPSLSSALLDTGTRRSSRVSKPSKRILDANNMGREIEVPKRARVARKNVVEEEKDDAGDDEDDEGDNDDEGDKEEDDDVVNTHASDAGGGDTDVEMGELVTAEDAYASTKVMGDQDRKVLSIRTKSDRTADVRTIFKREKEHVNVDTGGLEDGHVCTVCEKDPAVSAKHCFFLGNVTTLRTHIARHANHVEIYTQRCKKYGFQTNERVYARTQSLEGIGGPKQSSLDTVIGRQPKPPTFTTNGLLDYIVELIVSEDEAFQLIDKKPFRRLLTYLRPALGEKDIPHRTKLRAEILTRAKAVEKKIAEVFKDIPGKISFTFDTWTSEAGDPYLSLTGHYIGAAEGDPNYWELKCEQLGFTRIEGNHSGANLGGILIRVIDRYGIRRKIGWFTADNASNNFSAIREVANQINTDIPNWDAKQHYVRCMEHSIDLSARHFVEEVSPSSTAKLLKKIKKAFGDADISDTVDLDTLDAQLAGFDLAATDEEEGGVDEEALDADFSQFDVADSVGKALALVKQIRASPQARSFFKTACAKVEVPFLELLLWIRTRWASLFSFLDRILRLRKPLSHFAQFADESDVVPKLKGKNYSDFYLRKRDWEKLELMHEVLQEPASAKQTFSSSKEPSAFRTIPVLEFLKETWSNMANLPKFSEVKDAIQKGLQSLEKYHGKVEDSDAYFLCLFLDPNVKNAYALDKWQSDVYVEAMSRLEEVFDSYHEPLPDQPTTTTGSTPTSASGQYGHSWMRAAVRFRHDAERTSSEPRDELKRYIDSPLEDVANVVAWWGHHAVQYPTLSKMARDYLAIQGSATPSERAFSSGGTTGTAKRNRLKPDVFEALQLLKCAYRNGHIGADKEAHKHVLSIDLLESDDEMPDLI